MPITFECPTCKKQYTFKKDVSGREAKCICGEIFVIPEKSILGHTPAKSIDHAPQNRSNEPNVKSSRNQNEKFIIANIVTVLLVVVALSLYCYNKSKLQADKKSSDSSETTSRSMSQNPTMRELHDVLVPDGYVVDKYGGNMAWVKKDDAFYFEVHGGGTGQIDKEIKVLKRFKSGAEMWSAEKVKVQNQKIYIGNNNQWRAVFQGESQVGTRAGMEIDSHDEKENVSYGTGTVNYSLVGTIRKAWQEERMREKSMEEQAKVMATIVLLVQTDCPDPDDCNATLDYIQRNIDSW